MSNSAGLIVICISALLIAGADALIKKTSISGSFSATVFNPWMLAICALYFLQILLVIYIFINKGELAVYANLFIIFYSVLMVLAGVLIFRERLSLLQGVGIVLALAGAILINGF